MGEVHWRIRRSQADLTSLCLREDDAGIAAITAFGEEVGLDEIRWWVFHKDEDVNLLKERSEQALASAQVLKEEASALKFRNFGTYEGLVAALRQFADHCAGQIEEVLRYVRWLGERDRLCPALLFTYRVWGSTRQSDRSFEVAARVPEEDPVGVNHATDIVFGLVSRGFVTVESEYSELLSDAYDSMGPESAGVPVDASSLIARTCNRALAESAVYFEFLRDSIRNMIIDCEAYLAQTNLLHLESFWRGFIMKAMEPGRVETDLWDFKTTLGMWHAGGDALLKLRTEFCEHVAAFANERGGAIIIGVSDESPRQLVGVTDTEQKIQSLSQVVRKHTNLGEGEFKILQVLFRNDNGPKSCLVLSVAQTTGKIRVLHETGSYTYPIRDGVGLRYVTPEELDQMKRNVLESNFDFVADLNRFLHDR
jgi:hypothetical protein